MDGTGGQRHICSTLLPAPQVRIRRRYAVLQQHGARIDAGQRVGGGAYPAKGASSSNLGG